eukprot:g7630.t1
MTTADRTQTLRQCTGAENDVFPSNCVCGFGELFRPVLEKPNGCHCGAGLASQSTAQAYAGGDDGSGAAGAGSANASPAQQSSESSTGTHAHHPISGTAINVECLISHSKDNFAFGKEETRIFPTDCNTCQDAKLRCINGHEFAVVCAHGSGAGLKLGSGLFLEEVSDFLLSTWMGILILILTSLCALAAVYTVFQFFLSLRKKRNFVGQIPADPVGVGIGYPGTGEETADYYFRTKNPYPATGHRAHLQAPRNAGLGHSYYSNPARYPGAGNYYGDFYQYNQRMVYDEYDDESSVANSSVIDYELEDERLAPYGAGGTGRSFSGFWRTKKKLNNSRSASATLQKHVDNEMAAMVKHLSSSPSKRGKTTRRTQSCSPEKKKKPKRKLSKDPKDPNFVPPPPTFAPLSRGIGKLPG